MNKIELIGDKVTIEFNEEGGLARFINRETGRNYISRLSNDARPLFRLVCVEADGNHFLPWEIKLTSLQAEEKKVSKSNGELRFTFRKIYGKSINAVCSTRLNKDSTFSSWRIKVENRTNYAIRAIEFPVLITPMQLGESAEDDRILIPAHDGYLVAAPAVKKWSGEDYWGMRNSYRHYYPGEGRSDSLIGPGLSTQVVAYYDRDGGLYVATHDWAGHVKQLGPILVRDGIEFTPIHHMPEVLGNDYSSSYDTIIGCFQGDWQTAADVYKSWAKKQFWCTKRIVDREDIPDWIKKGAFFLFLALRVQEEGEDYLGRVLDYVKSWQKELAIPIVAVIVGWEKVAEWTGPDYLPPYGGIKRFRKMCYELKKRGIRTFVCLSGLKWHLCKIWDVNALHPSVDYNDLEDFRRDGEDYAATEPDGNPLISVEIADWYGVFAYAYVCVATPLAYSILHDSTMELIDLGVQICQADQIMGGATTACYNTKHGHPLGRGKWQTDSLRKIYKEVRRDGKAKDPDFTWSQEWQGESCIQELDFYLARNCAQSWGLVGVPLFSYLYHEYLSCFAGGLDICKDNPAGVYQQVASFVNGNLPAAYPGWGLSIHNCKPNEVDPKALRMLKNACLCIRAFPEFLILGKMLNTPPLHVPTTPITIHQWPSKTLKSMSAPLVLHQAWQLPDNNVAYALANISDKEQRFQLNVLRHGQTGPLSLVLYRNGGKGEVMATGVSLPYNVDLKLSSQDAAILRFASNK